MANSTWHPVPNKGPHAYWSWQVFYLLLLPSHIYATVDCVNLDVEHCKQEFGCGKPPQITLSVRGRRSLLIVEDHWASSRSTWQMQTASLPTTSSIASFRTLPPCYIDVIEHVSNLNLCSIPPDKILYFQMIELRVLLLLVGCVQLSSCLSSEDESLLAQLSVSDRAGNKDIDWS